MPIVSFNEINKESQWILWKIEEEIGHFFQLLDLSKEDRETFDSITNHYKKLEFLASRTSIKKLVENLGLAYNGIYKDEFGKPHLRNLDLPISLSHSYPYTVGMIHQKINIGIDLERFKEKILKIGPRFMNNVELADSGGDLKKITALWAAKESLYKLHGRKFLVFKDDLEIKPFTMSTSGVLQGKIKLPEDSSEHELNYENHEDYIIVFNVT